MERHLVWIGQWSTRLQRVFHGVPSQGTMGFYDPYLVWYRTITRRPISLSAVQKEAPVDYAPASIPLHIMMDWLMTISDYCGEIRHKSPEEFDRVRELCDEGMVSIGQRRRLRPFRDSATIEDIYGVAS